MATWRISVSEHAFMSQELPTYQRFKNLTDKLASAANRTSGAKSAALNADLIALYREYWAVRTDDECRAVIERYEAQYWWLR